MHTLTAALVATLACMVWMQSPMADPHAEDEALARLIHEIKALEPLVKAAESQTSPDARFRFRYDWLREDLNRIRSGLQDHIDGPRNEPRAFAPLRGDYRQ